MTQLVKLTISIKRKEGLSLEEFHRHWSDVHSRVFMGIAIVKTNVVKYVQYHVDAAATKELAHVAPILQFDGSAIFYARRAEDLLAIFSDPEYLSVVVPDEELFMDRAATQTMIGYDEDKTNVDTYP